ncbi:sensor histidine kinase [Aerococcus sanguinicola]|uniref:sensor histidine kinase n=1 Tax=Aerococcus sanguinicola TaxID=119206 RepID=UPI0018A73B5F|nr:GHKL domain-containing protein [Aerococcus sanguinicola]
MLAYLMSHLTLYDFVFQALVVYTCHFWAKGKRSVTSYLVLYGLLLSTALNPLIVSQNFYMTFNFLLVAAWLYWQWRELTQVMTMTALIFVNISCQDSYYFNLVYESLPYGTLGHFLVWLLGSVPLLFGLSRLEDWLWRRYFSSSIRRHISFLLLTVGLAFLLYFPAFVRDFQKVSAINSATWVYLALTNLFLLVFLVLAAALFYQGTERIRQAERQQAEQRIDAEYGRLISQQYKEMRRFRHDLKNLLVGFGGYIDHQNWEGLTSYYQSLKESGTSLDLAEDHPIFDLADLPNDALRELVQTKLSLALSYEIPVHVEVAEDLPQVQEGVTGLVRIVGILLDNAIEESEGFDQAELTFAVEAVEGYLSISVANRCQDPDQVRAVLQQRGQSTKAGPGQDRGYGLVNVQELSQQQGIQHFTSFLGDLLVQELLIDLNA